MLFYSGSYFNLESLDSDTRDSSSSKAIIISSKDTFEPSGEDIRDNFNMITLANLELLSPTLDNRKHLSHLKKQILPFICYLINYFIVINRQFLGKLST